MMVAQLLMETCLHPAALEAPLEQVMVVVMMIHLVMATDQVTWIPAMVSTRVGVMGSVQVEETMEEVRDRTMPQPPQAKGGAAVVVATRKDLEGTGRNK